MTRGSACLFRRLSNRSLGFAWPALALALAVALNVASGCAGGESQPRADDGGGGVRLDGLPATEQGGGGGDGGAGGDGGGAADDGAADGKVAPRDGRAADQRVADQRVPRDQRVADSALPDGPMPDVTVDAGTSGPTIGKVCVNDNNCGGGTRCLLDIGSSTRICTIACTPDNPSTTTVNEDTCPDLSSNICGNVPLAGGGTASFCLARCVPRDNANDCANGVACRPSSSTIIDDPGNAACVFPACKQDSDCRVMTAKACNGSTGSGCDATAGEVCTLIDASTAVCTLSGKCNLTSGLCGAHSRGKAGVAVGAPCASDVDCAGDQICLTQTSAGRWKNGYCSKAGCAFATLGSAACTGGSICNHAYSAGLCQKPCSQATASDCRGNPADRRGDYECYAWNNFTIGGTSVSSAPVCDVPIPCSLVAQCSSLGPASNVTVMECRDPASNAVVASSNSAGRCLDLTAAGIAP